MMYAARDNAIRDLDQTVHINATLHASPVCLDLLPKRRVSGRSSIVCFIAIMYNSSTFVTRKYEGLTIRSFTGVEKLQDFPLWLYLDTMMTERPRVRKVSR
jgi:hypothetical protein